MKCKAKLISSLEKVFFDNFDELPEYTSGSMLKNEIYSFQLVVKGYDEQEHRETCKIKIESELGSYIQIKLVGYVPSMLPAFFGNCDDDYITKLPGLLPDPLYSMPTSEMQVHSHQTRALWFTVEPNGEMTGCYPIVIKILNMQDEVLAEAAFNLDIIDMELPKLHIPNTGWFHGDCIGKLHNVDMMSEEYFEIVEKYIQVYTKFGHNMILTPVFTPPLDTEIGGERPTNQLVDVTLNSGKYAFDFTRLKRWIELCRKCGIEYFEISHLFTQWGAYNAPKIMANVDGEYKRIFGWETDALSDEYRTFLGLFLTELVDFLKTEGIMEKCFFHVSDEPQEKHESQYRAVKEILLPYLPEEQLIDALSSYEFYEKGIVTTPIACNDHIKPFIENGVERLWTYYCSAQGIDVANRLMAMPSYRNRILGYQLYKYDIKGFLQWGYNFWFTYRSRKVINPYFETCSGGFFQSGDAFVVYPLDDEGEVVPSLRLYVFNETMQDLRALKLLETVTDKQTVIDMLDEIKGFDVYPRNGEYILQLREMVNKKIKQEIGGN